MSDFHFFLVLALLGNTALLITALILLWRIHMSTTGLPQDIQDLQAAVAQETTVEQSAITLLKNLSAQLAVAIESGNPIAAVEAVIAQMNTNQTALAEAVTANTPSATVAAPVATK
jgi:hypothetical protein